MATSGTLASMFRPSDTFIAIMGVTGAGTQEVTVYTFKHSGRTIHLIDTPGFDDTYRTDSDVLKYVAYFLTKSYGEGYKLNGIIYLHPITHTRMNSTAFKNLRTFRKLCGAQSMSSVVLATTMWSDVTQKLGGSRESELRETAEFWGDMIREGSTVYRHNDDYNSAMNIISFLTNRKTRTTLGLQAEMVDQKLSLDDTEAGREVDKEMNKQRELFEKRLEDTHNDLEEAIISKDEQHVQDIIKEQEKFAAKLTAIQQGREELRISMQALMDEKERKHAEEMARINETLARSQRQSKEQSESWQILRECLAIQREQDEAKNKRRDAEILKAVEECKRREAVEEQEQPPPSYEEHPPLQYEPTSKDDSADPGKRSHETCSTAEAVGVGLATGALTGAALMGVCTIM